MAQFFEDVNHYLLCFIISRFRGMCADRAIYFLAFVTFQLDDDAPAFCSVNFQVFDDGVPDLWKLEKT